VLKEVEIRSHKIPRARIPRPKVKMDTAFSRHRKPKPIRMVAPHRAKRGYGITRRSDR
jgi:hypothetical protein